MCIIFISVSAHPGFKYVILSNRDEVYERSTSRLNYWPDQPSILAGKDNLRQGTWLGVTKNGRFSAVTNYRVPADQLRPTAKSRGELVTLFLTGSLSPRAYLEELARRRDDYDGFNLLVGDLVSDSQEGGIWYLSNKGPVAPMRLEPNKIYALSNGLLDDRWPKAELGKRLLREIPLSSPTDSHGPLLDLLHTKTTFNDQDLPKTGVPIEAERALSPIFVSPMIFADKPYGTRCSSVISVDHTNALRFSERALDNQSLEEGEQIWSTQEFVLPNLAQPT